MELEVVHYGLTWVHHAYHALYHHGVVCDL